MFINRHYWKMANKGDSVPKGPFSISERWPALPAVIDSAFEDMLTKKLYFFSGNKASCQHDHTTDKLTTNNCLIIIIMLCLQGPNSGYTRGRTLWAHAALRSLVCPTAFRRWREHCRGGRAKCCSSAGRTSGGKLTLCIFCTSSYKST